VPGPEARSTFAGLGEDTPGSRPTLAGPGGPGRLLLYAAGLLGSVGLLALFAAVLWHEAVGRPPGMEPDRPAARAWPLDALGRGQIPEAERFDDLPKGVVAVLGERRLRHWSSALCVAVSPDGKWVASGGADRVVRVWEAATGRERAVLKGARPVNAVAFAPDGKTLASAGDELPVRLWEVGTWKAMPTLDGHTGVVYALAFSPDGGTLASAGARPDPTGEVKLWDVATGRERRALGDFPRPVYAVAFSPDGKALVTGGGDGAVRLWDPGTGAARAAFEGHGGAVRAAAWSRDGGTLATVGADNLLRLWDVAAGKERLSRGPGGGSQAVALSPDGLTVVAGNGSGDLNSWDAKTGKPKGTERRHRAAVMGLAFTPDGRTLVSAGSDGTVQLADAASRQDRFSLHGHTGKVDAVAFAPGGDRLASAGEDRQVRLWDLRSGLEVGSCPWYPMGAGSLAFAPDGKALAVGTRDREVHLWRVTDEGDGVRLQEPSPLRGHTAYAPCVAFAGGGGALLSAAYEPTKNPGQPIEVVRWDPAGRKPLATVQAFPQPVPVLALAPDAGLLVAPAGGPGRVKVWDLAAGRETVTLVGPGNTIASVAVTADGKTVVAGSLGLVEVWDVPTATLREARPEHKDGLVRFVAPGLNGSRVASFGDDWRLVVWDVLGRRKLADWRLPGEVGQVVFAPDGRHLATANGNGTVYVFRVPESEGE
jgi:WD40 repeat protein